MKNLDKSWRAFSVHQVPRSTNLKEENVFHHTMLRFCDSSHLG